ncbi:glycosyltransferase family 4 protein [Psychromonas antarctica]|uniref:glycosyltransferase family 4 protein n=1 Tax=Psychromonas antarctica TaxID=67573 RepID=UPI001EE9A395|nr:glycosyltransferase family 1 protein [Psychromonas antarctica]MCG6202862.1 glycosyltransferase family 4 protein [Psychromonas antarctica]
MKKPLYLTSLYYLKNRITGANKRFDELGKRLIRSSDLDVYIIVQQGERPDWCDESKVIYIKAYNSKIQRLVSWLHLSWTLLRIPKGVLYSDFQPIPLFCGIKHFHYQLIHDLRNWTEFARGGLGTLSSLFQRWQLRTAYKVVTVSEFSKDDIICKCGLLRESIFVSYNGITDDYTKKDGNEAVYDFIYVATYEKRKNHLNLIKAIEKFPFDTKTCLIGRDLGSLPSIMRYIDSSSSRNLRNITFIDHIDEAELINLYQNTKIFVSPSLLEGFGMPLIESAACGTRACCSDIEVFREIMGESAYYFDPNNPDGIQRALQHALSDSGQASVLSITKFRWDSIENELRNEFLSNFS